MKKLSIIMLALALALVMAVPAMAIHVGSPDSPDGELGVTGRYQFDGESRDIDGETHAFFDDDLDIAFKWGMGDVVAYVSLEMSDRIFEGGNGGSRDSEDTNDDTNFKVPAVDNYYIEWAVMDNLKLKIGEYVIDFGRLVGLDGAGASNIQLKYSMENLDISGALVKNFEDNTPGDDNDDDEIILQLDVKNVGPFTKLAAASYTEMNDNSATENSYMGLDVGLDIGPVGLGFEYGANGGDLDGDFYVLEVGLGGLIGFDLNVNYFQSSDDYLTPYAGNDWSPVLIYGDNVNGDMTDTSAIWVDATYNLNDAMRLSAQYLFQAENDAGDAWGTEFDFGLRWAIADNVSWALAYGMYAEGDGLDGDDVDRTELFQRLQFTF